eukprot:m.866207 g.866207  ORF g.866207 m.866207 type:complete len:221 (-) comp23552_c0_seq6:3827-4489(-)
MPSFCTSCVGAWEYTAHCPSVHTWAGRYDGCLDGFDGRLCAGVLGALGFAPVVTPLREAPKLFERARCAKAADCCCCTAINADATAVDEDPSEDLIAFPGLSARDAVRAEDAAVPPPVEYHRDASTGAEDTTVDAIDTARLMCCDNCTITGILSDQARSISFATLVIRTDAHVHTAVFGMHAHVQPCVDAGTTGRWRTRFSAAHGTPIACRRRCRTWSSS